MVVDNCIISDSNRGISIQIRDGGNVRNVSFSNIIIETRRFADRQEDFYIRARMLYMITDRVSRDILCVGTARQKKDYMELLADEILHYTFEL